MQIGDSIVVPTSVWRATPRSSAGPKAPGAVELHAQLEDLPRGAYVRAEYVPNGRYRLIVVSLPTEVA